jgi:hypothetical protein
MSHSLATPNYSATFGQKETVDLSIPKLVPTDSGTSNNRPETSLTGFTKLRTLRWTEKLKSIALTASSDHELKTGGSVYQAAELFGILFGHGASAQAAALDGPKRSASSATSIRRTRSGITTRSLTRSVKTAKRCRRLADR